MRCQSEVVAPPLAADSAESKTPTLASDTAAATTSQPSPANAPSPQPTAPLGDELARRLTGVELQLSRIVAEPPATWQIDPLAREVEQLLAQAKTADERQAVQSTLAKIDRFAAIGRRYRGAPIQTAHSSASPNHTDRPTSNHADRRQPTAGQPTASATTPSASCVQSSRSGPVHRSSPCSTNAARSYPSSRPRRMSTCSHTSATASASRAAAGTSPSSNAPTSRPAASRRSTSECCDNTQGCQAYDALERCRPSVLRSHVPFERTQRSLNFRPNHDRRPD